MKKKRISQETLNLAIITLTTVLIWTGFDIYRAYTRTQVKPDVRKQLTPLNPKLDTETLEDLSNKKDLSLEKVKTFSPSRIIIETSPEENQPEPEQEQEQE